MTNKSIRSAPFNPNTPSLATDSHRLAGLIDRLHRSQNMPPHSEAITDILDELSTYAFDTLAHEERTQASMGIAVSAAHAREHLHFQEYVANHCLQATLGVSASKELLHFLLDWWHDHVQGTDLLELRARSPNRDLWRP